MSEGLTPLNRTEAILSGEDLTPTNRLEYFLKEAASGGAIPAPTEDDAGKVPVANNDGTASWQTPSGGGGWLTLVATGVGTLVPSTSITVPTSTTVADFLAAFDPSTAKPVFALQPLPDWDNSPYYSYGDVYAGIVSSPNDSALDTTGTYVAFVFYNDN